MSKRSATFAPIDNQGNPLPKAIAKSGLTQLQTDIKAFKDAHFAPEHLTQVADLPIYTGNTESVKAYQALWQPLIDRALTFYPKAFMPPDHLPLPASLEMPQFVYHVWRLNLTRTLAKESKTFGSVTAMQAKCGDFKAEQLAQIQAALSTDDKAKLVAHREFIDLRAYVFCKDPNGLKLPPRRLRFYRTGLVLATIEHFEVVDSRKKPRKRRNDAYQNPLADNGVWRVYLKKPTL